MSTLIASPPWTLGEYLAKARRMAQLTQREMADELGIGLRNLIRYENDQTIPNRAIRMAWAFRCGVPYEWFATEDDSEPGSADRRSRRSSPTSSRTSRKGAKRRQTADRMGDLRAVA